MKLLTVGIACGAAAVASHVYAAEPVQVSGVYPHLAHFNADGECGTGAVVPWADRLWVITYSPHRPKGSSDKLYEIDAALRRTTRPESVGGTPANRMIHRESRQLFIGPYVIDAQRQVRVIPPDRMFGRLTGLARHLTDPAARIVYATMEEGFYDVDVRTLEVTELFRDEQVNGGRKADLPGYHGKGFYSAQGRYVYANNGEHGQAALTRPEIPSGCLAEWDGRSERWTVVRRNQFTEVTGPGGIHGNAPGDDRLWSIGWDHRSLILMLRDGGRWHAYRLPKASHAYDGAHGWNTEWPRIREIGEEAMLMTMHGSFWRFPQTFSAADSAGIAPRSTYLKVVGDFCRWGDRVVLGCDDTAKSEFLNKDRIKGSIAGPGVSQSNLWFVPPARLDGCGPPLGRGAVWLNEEVRAGVPSEPFLLGGFAHRGLYLTHGESAPVTFTLETDARGNGNWTKRREVSVAARGSAWLDLTGEQGAWVRIVAGRDAARATAFFHYRGEDRRGPEAAAIFSGIARPADASVTGGLLHARGGEAKTLRLLARGPAGELGCYDLDESLRLTRADDPAGAGWIAKNVAVPPPVVTADGASVLYVDGAGRRWRLPKGDPAFDLPGVLGPERTAREVCTERNLLNLHGTFYELPAENAGGFAKLRPIATHNRRIADYASYRGLLVLAGIADGAAGERVVRSSDGACAVWTGVVDDLWQFGKPRGRGGPWLDAAVRANEPSDPYLMTGYDRKRVTLSHRASTPVRMRIEVDLSGSGDWVAYEELAVPAGRSVEHTFPDAFGAYWVRVVADQAATATVQFVYE